MLRLVKEQVYFFIPFLAWIVLGACAMLLTDQEELHLLINRLNHSWLDPFFKYITYLGDGAFAAFIVLLGLVYKLRYGAIGLISLLMASGITQALKRFVFADEFRPIKVLGQINELHLVEGISMHTHHSFPSGHATVALMTFLFLSLLFKHRVAQVVCIALGWLAAISRVYISQHFFEDVYVGSVIGTITTLVLFAWLHQKTWGERGLTESLVKR